MLLAGDEIGRTQHGNNNAYCQDNEISWFDWENVDEELLEFTSRLSDFRKRNPCSAAGAGSRAGPIHGSGVSDIAWFKPDGSQMTDEDWQRRLREDDRRVPERRRVAVAGRGGASGARRLVPPALQRALGADRVRDPGGAVGPGVVHGDRHRDRGAGTADPFEAG